jgi:signal transduction histidine kinase
MRSLPIWSAYALSLLLASGGLGWFTWHVVDLERRQWEVAHDSRVSEMVRDATWRMEYAIGLLVNQEASRPHYHFTPYHLADRPIESLVLPEFRDLLTTSPLLAGDVPLVRLHFQLDADEKLVSAQFPRDEMRRFALERGDVTAEQIAATKPLIDRLEALTRSDSLRRVLRGYERQPRPVSRLASLVEADSPGVERSMARYRARSSNEEGDVRGRGPTTRPLTATSPPVSLGSMHALWWGEFLVLARLVVIGDEPLVQGCVLDHAGIERRLLDDVADLLPAARLTARRPSPTRDDTAGAPLVGLPYLLAPGDVAVAYGSGISPLRKSLVLALLAALAAAVAVAILIRVLARDAERRAAFVSTVTHELRTPLTTLRMYAEMLESGKVASAKVPQYYATLRREADRLAKLVENVLAYSRLEAARTTTRCAPIGVDILLARGLERARERAAAAGFEIVTSEPPKVEVDADVAAVEQILFNLVDNAVKYADGAQLRRIEVVASEAGSAVKIEVRDHGPGVEPAAVRKLFLPFERPDRAESSGRPGVGLGLALCRRLARAMHGDLALAADRPAQGARFVLTLQRSSRAAA